MKSLKPSVRERKRYILVKGKKPSANVPKAVMEFLGVLGSSEASLKIIEKDDKNGIAIFTLNREVLDKVRGAIAVFSEKMEVVKVSGTLKGLRGKK